jgi:hypothetical protein
MSATDKTEARMTRRTVLDIEEMILRLFFVFWTILSLLEAQGLLIYLGRNYCSKFPSNHAMQ